jgi:hypothetical protein
VYFGTSHGWRPTAIWTDHGLVDEPTRSVLEKALALGTVVVALTIQDRERLLWALDDARADALAELRAVLLQEHEARVRDGLV